MQASCPLQSPHQSNSAGFQKAVSTASPDQQLQTLLEQQAAAEQKLASDSIKLGAENPELLSTKSLLERIDHQVSDRLDGILEDLRLEPPL